MYFIIEVVGVMLNATKNMNKHTCREGVVLRVCCKGMPFLVLMKCAPHGLTPYLLGLLKLKKISFGHELVFGDTRFIRKLSGGNTYEFQKPWDCKLIWKIMGF